MNADTTAGGRALRGGVLGGTAGDGWGRAAAYDAYADGLHTYALWYLRDHDAAADAVYCAFAAADRNHTTLQQPEQIQPWLYALLRRECRLRAAEPDAPTPVSGRLRPKADGLGDSGVGASLLQLEGNLRRAEFHSLAWPDAEGLAPAHREVLELTIRHGLDSRGLALVLGLRESAGLSQTRGFGLLADAWRELERSLAAAAVAGSGRENCAQLAELTFGWSGKLNATLRAPLTEHVDGCSRCQHYLHTVIGTPSAPTILPFVAAPRALRDLLLGELADAEEARLAGVDLIALGRRCGQFGPEGFPARIEAAHAGTTGAGSGASVRPPRRRQPSQRPHRAPRSGATTSSARTQSAPETPPRGTDEGLPPRPSMSQRGPVPSQSPSQSQGQVPRQGPNQSERQGQGQSQSSGQSSNQGQVPRQGANPERRLSTSQLPAPGMSQRATPRVSPRPSEPEDVYRAHGSWADRVLPPQQQRANPAGDGSLWRPEPPTEFVQTASGRFAIRAPGLPPKPSHASGDHSATPSAPQPAPASASGSRLPRYRAGGAGVRARHKARPMRQAVVSAVALGAIGAVAATAAALLGGGGDGHANTALENAPSNDVVGALDGPAAAQSPSHDGLSVSVSATGNAAAQPTTGRALSADPSHAASTTAVASSAAASGGFYVSVNQRDGDPYSVQILLRNVGTAPLNWSAAPSVSWLTLSQSSGTLAPGQSLSVRATATSAAPSGQWSAQIAFQPGGIVATVHGGIPAEPSSPASATGGASSTPSASPSTGPSTPSAPPSSTSSPAGPTTAPSTSPSAAASHANSAGPSQSQPALSPTASAPASTPASAPAATSSGQPSTR